MTEPVRVGKCSRSGAFVMTLPETREQLSVGRLFQSPSVRLSVGMFSTLNPKELSMGSPYLEWHRANELSVALQRLFEAGRIGCWLRSGMRMVNKVMHPHGGRYDLFDFHVLLVTDANAEPEHTRGRLLSNGVEFTDAATAGRLLEMWAEAEGQNFAGYTWRSPRQAGWDASNALIRMADRLNS